VAVVGPSGCGKSTLLGLLGALDRPTSGRVRVGNAVLSALGSRERAAFRRANVGLVPQNDNLLPFLTVEENVALPLALRGSAAEPAEVGRLLGRLGLSAELGRVPDQLSGGQRQRVAIARAVVHRPRLLLADEPTGALDAGNAAVVADLLLEVARELGATLVVATHDRATAARMDRVVELRDGTVVADGGAGSGAG
jgi:putative ABC transport system ATP-binding protein